MRTMANPLRLYALEDRTVPNTYPVVNGLDSGPGSLRQAVLDANANPGPDTITFAHGVHSITLTTGELAITDGVTVQGPGANKLSVSGNDASRVFDIAGGTVTISGLTVTRGRADGTAAEEPGAGGGILNQAGASLTLSGVVVADNRAVGDPNVVLPTNPVFNLAGGATGGGIANFGVLAVTNSTVADNQALGADFTDSSAFSFPGPAFAGNALGGGLSNFGSASVSGSQFSGNLARAGSHDIGDFASIGGGGAILNDATLTVTGSSFRQNQAIGGSESVSPFHNGHALGGAIMSGSLLPLAGGPGATLSVGRSTFDHNQAVGGDNNTVTLPPASVAPADGPDNGYGGAILVYQGSASISRTTVTHNRAVGGAGGAAQNGSLGVGGGIFLFNFVGGVTADISGCRISHNEAIGGPGSDGLGGGVAVGSLGAPFGGPGTTMIRDTLIDHNRALGGDGSAGGGGGNGLGGGVYADASSTLAVARSAIVFNKARGGDGNGGTDGAGIGGGVYNLGALSLDSCTVIRWNHASTSNDDVYP